MQDTFVTFHGWVGSDVRHRTVGEATVASFRVGVTPRLRRQDAWIDGETTWYSVTAWRTLADHVRQSIRKGDPVIVHGRLRTETWTPENGTPSLTLLVEATLVGHDLNRGCSHYWRQRPVETPSAEPGEASEPGEVPGPTDAGPADPEGTGTRGGTQADGSAAA